MKFKKVHVDHLKFNVERSLSRRKNSDKVPPYITEEGLVLIDRRSNKDRRLDDSSNT